MLYASEVFAKRIKCFMKYLRSFCTSHAHIQSGVYSLISRNISRADRLKLGWGVGGNEWNKVVWNLIKAVIYQCMHAHQHIIAGTRVNVMCYTQTDKRLWCESPSKRKGWKISGKKHTASSETNEGWKWKAFEVSSFTRIKKHFHHIQFERCLFYMKMPFNMHM